MLLNIPLDFVLIYKKYIFFILFFSLSLSLHLQIIMLRTRKAFNNCFQIRILLISNPTKKKERTQKYYFRSYQIAQKAPLASWALLQPETAGGPRDAPAITALRVALHRIAPLT